MIQWNVLPDCPQSRWRDKQGIVIHIGVSIRHITELQKRRILPFVKAGRSVRFDIHAVDRALKALETQSVLLRAENN